jgi:hypothetical protein
MGSVDPSGSRDLTFATVADSVLPTVGSSEGHERSGGGQGFNQTNQVECHMRDQTNSVNSDSVVGPVSG